jgi:hypothetical protein
MAEMEKTSCLLGDQEQNRCEGNMLLVLELVQLFAVHP